MARNTIYDAAHRGDFDFVSKKLEEDPKLLEALDTVSILLNFFNGFLIYMVFLE